MKPARYRHILAMILLSFLIVIAVPKPFVGAPLRVAVLGILLQVVIQARRKAGKLSRPAWIVSLVLFVTTLVAAFIASVEVLDVIAHASMILLVAASIAILVATLRTAGVVDMSVVRGVLSIYLLIALEFASIYELGAAVTPHFVDGVPSVTPSNALYFSIITMTTVGYGDITPGNGLAEAVAAAEALIGQLYLVSVVAAVVSRFRPASTRD